MTIGPVLSHYQTADLLKAKQEGRDFFPVSFDLGITSTALHISQRHIALPNGIVLSWETIETINENKDNCFYIKKDGIEKIRGYSETTGRSYSLFPTSDAPSLLIAGFLMHRIKGITPWQSALSMVQTIAPFHGQVLDTSTGLGYTAICAAKTASKVITVEIDPVAQEMARLNCNPKLSIVMGDSFQKIASFDSSIFSAILHDPPSMSIAGDLYSGEFYRQAYRVLTARGRMFHYIGDPISSLGGRVTKGVVRRLKESGFTKVVQMPAQFGVVAYK
jgi:predicted methyltransferase